MHSKQEKGKYKRTHINNKKRIQNIFSFCENTFHYFCEFMIKVFCMFIFLSIISTFSKNPPFAKR